jgi:hypothetical protein
MRVCVRLSIRKMLSGLVVEKRRSDAKATNRTQFSVEIAAETRVHSGLTAVSRFDIAFRFYLALLDVGVFQRLMISCQSFLPTTG